MVTNSNNDKKNEHPSKKQHRLLAYFRDDQIMFLVTHENESISDNLLRRLKDVVEAHLLEGGTIELLPEVLPQRFSFPATKEGEERLDELKRLDAALKKLVEEKHKEELSNLELSLKEQGVDNLHPLHRLLLQNDDISSPYQPEPSTSAFSLLVFNLMKSADDPLSLVINVLRLRTALRGEAIQIEGGDPEKKSETLKIEDISPNWAMSAASNGSGTGGPGGLPRPFKGKDDAALYKFDIIENLGALYGEGENVDVVILDTAPCPHALVHAPKQWPDNDLIQGLLGPDGKFSLYPATLEELRRMDNASLNRHDYEMSDHGLFAAGIVHSIAPKAKIHLIEVLNQWGIGDFLSLAAGLEKALKQIYQPGLGRRLVVNCSWMLDLPLVGDHCSPIDATKPEHDFEQAILHFALKEREQASVIWAVCNSIFLAGGQVVAAAGNDWGLSKKRKEMKGILRAGQGGQTQEPRPKAPEARYPAGYFSAIGVGALPKESKPQGATVHRASDYSNLGDKPERKAIMTLGGEEGENQGKNNGVLGLYLAETYPVEVNHDPAKYKREFIMERRKKENNEENAWAWWSGTSFATPILTGTIAAALSSKLTDGTYRFANTQSVVPELYSAGIILENQTEAHEDVMVVAQG